MFQPWIVFSYLVALDRTQSWGKWMEKTLSPYFLLQPMRCGEQEKTRKPREVSLHWATCFLPCFVVMFAYSVAPCFAFRLLCKFLRCREVPHGSVRMFICPRLILSSVYWIGVCLLTLLWRKGKSTDLAVLPRWGCQRCSSFCTLYSKRGKKNNDIFALWFFHQSVATVVWFFFL